MVNISNSAFFQTDLGYKALLIFSFPSNVPADLSQEIFLTELRFAGALFAYFADINRSWRSTRGLTVQSFPSGSSS
jgi:hypothetical protein